MTDLEFVDISRLCETAMANARRKSIYVKIIEQPASKAMRFRYECEGRLAGSIPGVNSTPENKTFPTIQIVGYKGPAIVVVTCVTKDTPFRIHPHNLVGKEGCKNGICTLRINKETMMASFPNLGIQCVKRKNIQDVLRVREETGIDPFNSGFAHCSQPTSISLNAVRLCFQVFIEDGERGKFNFPLTPIVSNPIYDKKDLSDLAICDLSDDTCTVAGGKKIILLCEKVAKDDIQIQFFEERDGDLVWEGFGDFQPAHIHRHVAISFKTPRYKSLEVEGPIDVKVQLLRPSDGATSEPLPFEYVPLNSALITGGPPRNGADMPSGYKSLEAEGPIDVKVQLLSPSDGATSEPLPFEYVPLDSANMDIIKEEPGSDYETYESEYCMVDAEPEDKYIPITFPIPKREDTGATEITPGFATAASQVIQGLNISHRHRNPSNKKNYPS